MLKHTVEEIELKSGAKGLLIDIVDASVMSAQINFRAGDVYVEDPLKWETAHIMEHMSLGANNKYRTAKAFTAEIEKNGAYSNASTGNTDMTYMMECADFEWERVLSLLCLGISEPLFLDEEFKAEYSNVHEEMLYRSNNHSWQLSLEMAKKFGFNTRTVQDRIELMPNVKVEDVRKHYNDTHYAQNMRFVIAGNIKGRKRTIISLLDSMKLPIRSGGERIKIKPESPVGHVDSLFIENTTVPNAYFYIDMYKKSEISRDNVLALGVLNAILVDTWGSRIFGAARERGLIYYLQSSTDRSKDYSSWWFGAQISEDQLNNFFSLLVGELKRIKRGLLKESEIESAKLYMIGGHQRSAQTVDSLVNGYAGSYYYEGRVNDYFTKFPHRVKKVTKREILDAAHTMFSDNVWGIGFLGTISEQARQEAHDQLSELWS